MSSSGSGAAMSQTKSHSPRSHTLSMICVQSLRIVGSLSRTRFGVKPAVHEATATRVERVVHRDHHREPVAVRARAGLARERLRVLLDREHVGVAGDAPHVAALVVVDGRVVAHPLPEVVRLVRVPVAVEQVDVVADGMRRGHCAPCVVV